MAKLFMESHILEKMLSFKTKSQGFPLSWISSQLSTWAHKCQYAGKPVCWPAWKVPSKVLRRSGRRWASCTNVRIRNVVLSRYLPHPVVEHWLQSPPKYPLECRSQRSPSNRKNKQNIKRSPLTLWKGWEKWEWPSLDTFSQPIHSVKGLLNRL